MSAKMNNFSAVPTTTETLPKSGHVTEVCKEWLVREDGALAYKLQSQEINDFYKGNRTRNAVVREDFPTALQEQIKEKETADKQVEAYRKRLKEQEQHDKRVAKEIAEKLERDLQEQKLRELRQSEKVAKEMQEIYVNLPPIPPPSARDLNKIPPPRPAKSSTLQQQHQNQPVSPNGYRNPNSPQYPILLQQHHFSNTDGYVGLALQATPAQQRHQQQQRSPNNTNPFVVRGDNKSPNQLPPHQSHSPSSSYRQGQNKFDTNSSQNSSSSSSSASRRNNVFDNSANNMSTSFNAPTTPNTPLTPKTPTHGFMHTPPPPLLSQPILPGTSPAQIATDLHPGIEELIEYSDVADSIRRYDMSSSSTTEAIETPPSAAINHQHPFPFSSTSPAHQNQLLNHHNHQTPQQSSAHLHASSKINRLMSPSNENLLKNDPKFQKLSPDKYDQMIGIKTHFNPIAAKERHLQEHADDIELYVDPCDYAGLKESGLPMQEIKEMSAKMKQEQKDELLARRLQELEVHDGMTLEERDRMLAIEAQDKELARMLQERMDYTAWDILRPGVITLQRGFSFSRALSDLRLETFTGLLPKISSYGIREKAKAKRAKEKARQRKSQQKESPQPNGLTLNGHNNNMASNQQHMQPEMMSASISSMRQNHILLPGEVPYQSQQEDVPDLDAYSSPIDVIKHTQRTQNGCLTNGSLTRDIASQQARHASLAREDDIYTLPVDSCRPGQNGNGAALVGLGANSRPASMSVCADNGVVGNYSQNSMTRSENFSVHSHDSMNSRNSSTSKTQSFDKNSSPTPPYMPIQGTRRSNSSEDRKKKSKDNKCTHQ